MKEIDIAELIKETRSSYVLAESPTFPIWFYNSIKHVFHFLLYERHFKLHQPNERISIHLVTLFSAN